jgi:hypothetical protein
MAVADDIVASFKTIFLPKASEGEQKYRHANSMLYPYEECRIWNVRNAK